MKFGILGPLVVWRDGHEVSIGAAKQRALLVLLLLRRGELVPTETLVDELWGERPPATAVKVVQVYVSQLRKALGARVLESRPAGYMLRLEPGALDSVRFEDLLTRARGLLAGGDAREAGEVLREALGLWRGPALGEFAYESFARSELARLEELRLVALELRLEADLALGMEGAVVGELQALAAAHPLRERLHGQLMIALYRSGRQAEALDVYQQLRGVLVEQLGIEPSAPIKQLERAILGQDAALDLPGASGPPAGMGVDGRADGPGAPLEAQPSVERDDQTLGRTQSRVRLALLAGVVVVAAAATAAALVVTGGSSRAAAIAANSVGFIDVRGGYVGAQVSVEAAPTSAAFGVGALWVSNANAGTVSRIDPVTRSVAQTITVGNSPSGIAVGGGGVWVANHDDNTVAWINPESNTVVKYIGVGSGPTAVAYGYGSVWVTNADDRSVSRINPARGAVTKTIQTGAVGRGIAVGGGYLWVTDESTRTVVQIDPATNTVAGTPVVGTGPTGVTYGDGAVWVANALDNTVTEIDASTLTIRAVIPVAGSPSAVAFGAGSVWVSAEFGARVVRIDPRTSTVVGFVSVGNRPEGLVVAGGGVWVAVQSLGRGHYGGRLVVLGTSLDSIDPAFGGPPVTPAIYDGLTATRHTGGSAGTQLVPDLAAALPQPIDRGKSYTFHLRPDVRYSNGTPLRAADFRRALEREATLNSAGSFSSVLGIGKCKPHRTCDLSRGVLVNGPSTLTLRLSRPDPTLLFDLTSLVPIPAGTPLRDVGTNPVPSTGAYEIQSYSPGRLLTLIRNRYFHVWSQAARPDGYPDEIVYRIVTNTNQAVRAVLAGRADLLTEDVPNRRVTELAARYPNQLHLVPEQATVFVFLNVRRPPFNDIRVRQALNYAVDRKRMTVLHGGALLAQPTCQLVPPTVPGYRRYCPYTINPDSSGDWKAPDLAKARALVAASKTKGQSVVVWTFTDFHREGLYVVGLLQQLGYKVKLHYIADLNRYFNTLARTPNAQAGLFGWFGTVRAVDMLSSITCRYGPENPAHFCDPQIDAQIAHLTTQQPSPAAAKLAATIDREIVDRAPWVPLFTPRLPDLTSSRVGNYQDSPYGYPLIDQMWVR